MKGPNTVNRRGVPTPIGRLRDGVSPVDFVDSYGYPGPPNVWYRQGLARVLPMKVGATEELDRRGGAAAQHFHWVGDSRTEIY